MTALKTVKNIANAVIVFAAVSFIIYLLLDRTDRITPADVDSSIQRGQSYLVQAYNDQHTYEDSYLECSPKYTYYYICDPRLKRIDASIDLIWIRDEVQNHTLIDYQIRDAERFLAEQDKYLETQPFFNTQNLFIADQHCILASMYNDTKITKDVESIVKPYGWTEENVLDDENKFRKIAFESWCVMLLAEKGSNRSTAITLSEYMLNESLYIIQETNTPALPKAYGALHTLWVFKKLKTLGYDINPYAPKLKVLQDYIASAADDPSVVADTEAQTMFLMILSDYNYSQDTNRRIAVRIMDRQDAGGWWNANVHEPSDFARAFTTLHAIMALNRYKLAYMS